MDGVSFMMRGELPELMERVLGRVPEREELVRLSHFLRRQPPASSTAYASLRTGSPG